MRHVPFDPKTIEYPDGWEARAQAAREAVQAASDDQRANVIKGYNEIWKALKPALEKVIGNKCWYTESPQDGTDRNVDHFRPKSSVKNVKDVAGKDHPGYWWMAFDPANYRLSCICANCYRRNPETGVVGGKADEFPLWDENNRAWSPSDDCDQEQPLLIDPCKSSEVALLLFGGNGEAIPRHNQNDRPRAYAMADKSIRLYNINHSDFIKARISLRVEANKNVQDAKIHYKKLDQGDADNDRAYERAIERLRNAIKITAPYSRSVLDLLEPLKYEDYLYPVFV